MKNRQLIISCLLILAIAVLWFWHQNNSAKYSAHENLFRNTNNLILTKHARCRMECRQITLDEIKEILHNGSENYDKTRKGHRGNMTYALEGYSSENQHIRVVVAPENNEVVVITCIDLARDWPCNCN